MNKFAVLVLSTLCMTSYAFQVAPSLVQPTRSFSKKSPLFVAAEMTNGEASPVVKNIDKDIAIARKKLEKYEAKLTEFTSKIETLE